MTLDLIFPVLGDSLPTDHSYLLFAAASHLAPVFHDKDAAVRLAAITGTYAGGGRLLLDKSSSWRVRLPDERIRDVLTLAGKSLRVGDHQIRLGAPSVAALVPAPSLIARIVTFKASQPRDRACSVEEPNRFLDVARKKREAHGIKGEPAIPMTDDHAGQPWQRREREEDHLLTPIDHRLSRCGEGASTPFGVTEINNLGRNLGQRLLLNTLRRSYLYSDSEFNC
jgi:CRISPR-associated protein Cas6